MRYGLVGLLLLGITLLRFMECTATQVAIRLLGSVLRANFFQHGSQHFQFGRGDALELPLVQGAHRTIKSFQKLKTLRCYISLNHATVVALAFASDEIAFFHPIQEAGNVRVARDHAFADFAAGQSRMTSAAKDTQYIVLGRGQARGFDYLFGLSAQGVGDLHEGDEQAGLRWRVVAFMG